MNQNQHGRRFIELRDFKSHANSLNVKSFKDNNELDGAAIDSRVSFTDD